MSEQEPDVVDICPDCGEELWYDQAEGCWVCESCGEEFGDQDWDDDYWDEEEDEEEEEEGDTESERTGT